MGTISFLLPAGLKPDLVQELDRASVAGGPDNMPWPTQVKVEPGRMSVRREVDESGCLVLPWDIDGVGRLMGMTATLVERELPYYFPMELVRGKVNQLRSQAADWQTGGLHISEPLKEQVRAASIAFSHTVTEPPTEQTSKKAQSVLGQAYGTADQLVRLYIDQMFGARHQRQVRLDSSLGCRLNAIKLDGEQAQALLQMSNSACLSFSWNEVEPAEATYSWEAYDALLEWALQNRLPVTAGPLIDFSTSRLPDWLWLWDRDLSSLATFMCDYVETTVKRYAGKIRTWQLTTASNSAAILGLGEDELLSLTARLVEAARQVDPKLELIIGISQPWGEYMALEDRTHSPFIFADTLIRSGLNFAALDIELVMGVSPRGSYCRDLLEASRLLDLYTLLGVPLRVTLGYPSASSPDPKADAELGAKAGHWRAGFSPETQADWAAAFTALALCKPSVRAVNWAHFTDASPHLFPHCGLLNAQQKPKPALRRLRELREQHLR